MFVCSLYPILYISAPIISFLFFHFLNLFFSLFSLWSLPFSKTFVNYSIYSVNPIQKLSYVLSKAPLLLSILQKCTLLRTRGEINLVQLTDIYSTTLTGTIWSSYSGCFLTNVYRPTPSINIHVPDHLSIWSIYVVYHMVRVIV